MSGFPLSLYWAPASPFVRKVMASAHALGLADQIEILDSAANPVERDYRIQAFNPLARVPAARSAEGLSLYDSRVICEYLDDLAAQSGGTRRLFPQGPARWQALRRQALADGMIEAGLALRYESLLRPTELQWPLWLEKQREKLQDALGAMAVDIPQDDCADIGAISMACALGWLSFRFPDIAWRAAFPALALWAEAFDERPEMRATRPQA